MIWNYVHTSFIRSNWNNDFHSTKLDSSKYYAVSNSVDSILCQCRYYKIMHELHLVERMSLLTEYFSTSSQAFFRIHKAIFYNSNFLLKSYSLFL
jgi:hypothetical protein